VTERGDVVGLLEMTLATAPSAETVRTIAQVAHLMAYVVIANRRHTDLFEWGQRSRPFTLSAEIQQRLLPQSRTCEATAFTLVGWLEPAASIGGDTFDYSLARDVLHLSLTDAMGHGVGSALTATVCLASLRGSRRVGATLLEQVQEANTALCQHASRGNENDFATGLVGRVDLTTGVLETVNAGHVVPFLIRSGRISTLDLPPDLPLGMFGGSTYKSTRAELVPGDRVVFVTDGMLERNVARVNLPATLADTQSLHPREAVRAMADKALEAAGHELADDATVLCLDWHGSHEHTRSSVAGADPERASAPMH
jgi:serine phosphatase RsbU (regulator of sigma subunit)